MSRRDEIRQKEQLQLDLQAQFNKLDQTVLSWLKPKSTEAQDKKKISKDVINKDELKFGNQIIIPSGKGIDFSSDKNSNINDSKGTEKNLTINEFLNNVGNKNNRKDNKILKNDTRFNSKMNSNSIRALQNKLRNEKREFIKKDKRKEVKKINIKTEQYSSSDEDEDDEILSRKSNNSKNLNKTNKNKRPF